jgi:hypothetical protein
MITTAIFAGGALACLTVAACLVLIVARGLITLAVATGRNLLHDDLHR